MPSDLGVRNNQTDEPEALCLWNDTTLPVTRFLGFTIRSETKQCVSICFGLLLQLHR